MQKLRLGNEKREQYGRIAATSIRKISPLPSAKPLLSSFFISLIALIVTIAQHTSHSEFRSQDVGRRTNITWFVT
jgi:hypothetical protein